MDIVVFGLKLIFVRLANARLHYIKIISELSLNLRNHKTFSLSLSDEVPLEQPPPQSNCRPASGGVKCVWSFIGDSLITC